MDFIFFITDPPLIIITIHFIKCTERHECQQFPSLSFALAPINSFSQNCTWLHIRKKLRFVVPTESGKFLYKSATDPYDP